MNNLIYFKVFVLFLFIVFVFIKEKGVKFYHPAVLISIIYFIEFGVSTLYMTLFPLEFLYGGFEPKLINEGLNFVIFVFIVFLMGFYAPYYNKDIKNLVIAIVKKIPNVNNYVIQIKNFPLVIILLLTFGWIARLILIKLGVYLHAEAGYVASKISGFRLYAQYLNIGSLFPMIALALTFFEWIKNPKNKIFLFLSLFLLSLEIAYALPTGSKERVLAPIFIILILYTLRYKMAIIPFLIAIVFFGLFVFPLTSIFRFIYSGDIVGDFQEAFSMYLQLFNSSNLEVLSGIMFMTFGERFNYIDVVSRVVHYTPQIWDFKLGYSYFLFFIGLIPRVFWHNKPDIAVYGNDFGHDYGFLYPGDTTTSVDMTWVGEMFINFGWYGIIVAFMYGLLYQTIYSYFMRYGKLSSFGVILYSLGLFYMVRGGLFAAQFGGLLKIWLVLFLISAPLLSKK